MSRAPSQPPLPEDLHAAAIRLAQVQTMSHCNGRCVMCPSRLVRDRLPQGTMSWSLWSRILDELARVPTLVEVAPFLQNEPLLDRRMPEIVRTLKQRLPRAEVSLSTNGSLLTEELFDELVAAGLDALVFSLNALTPETFRKVQPGHEFASVVGNLERALERRPPHLRMIVKAMAVRDSVLELDLPGRFSDLARRLEEAQVPLHVSAISNRGGSLEGYDDMLILEQTQSSRHKSYCEDPFFNLNVLFNGDIIACCADWERKAILGNLGEQGLAEIWAGPAARHMRELVASGRYRELTPCRDCSQARNILACRGENSRS